MTRADRYVSDADDALRTTYDEPMTLAEYARIYHYVAGENPY